MKLFAHKGEEQADPERNPVVRFFRRHVPLLAEYGDGRFFVYREGRRYATLLALVLVAVETTDVMFATDSIPAILAISRDPFIVYTSNVFAILGLRSLFFALAGLMAMFHFLSYGLSLILVFIGAKMLLAGVWEIPTAWALAVVGVVLAAAVTLSLLFPERPQAGA